MAQRQKIVFYVNPTKKSLMVLNYVIDVLPELRQMGIDTEVIKLPKNITAGVKKACMKKGIKNIPAMVMPNCPPTFGFVSIRKALNENLARFAQETMEVEPSMGGGRRGVGTSSGLRGSVADPSIADFWSRELVSQDQEDAEYDKKDLDRKIQEFDRRRGTTGGGGPQIDMSHRGGVPQDDSEENSPPPRRRQGRGRRGRDDDYQDNVPETPVDIRGMMRATGGDRETSDMMDQMYDKMGPDWTSI